MKKTRKIVIYCFAMITLFTLAWGLLTPSKASLYPNLSPNGLKIQGQTQAVSTSQLNQPVQTTFTFQTTDLQYEGYMGGDYILQYDPEQMDIDLSSFYQQGVYAPNDNIHNFTANGEPATPGMVWISCSNALPSQNYALSVDFINLFKDGKRRPAEVRILNVTESEFIVSLTGTNGKQMDNVTHPVIHSSYIELADITIKIVGEDTLVKGSSSHYQANVENALVDEGVLWSIEGHDSILTQIDQAGNLVVDSKETASTIDIVATSKEDGSIIARKTIVLENIPVQVLSIEGKEEVYKGKSGYEYIAKLEGESYSNVEWSLRGEHHPQTTIDQLGILTVDLLEESGELMLCATSKADGTLVAYKKVKVIEEVITGSIIGKDELIKGTKKEGYQFVSENIGEHKYYWKIVGGSSSNTLINEIGEVNIGIDETSQEVELQVYLSGKDTLIASKKVRVIEEVITGSIIGKDELIKGDKKEAYQFVSENIGEHKYYWKIVGGSSSNTSINEAGEVNIGIDETNQEVELQVYLSGKDMLIASKKVRVIERTYIITDIKLKYPKIWLSTSQNKSDLIGEIEKNQVAIVTFKTIDGKFHTIEVPILSYSYVKEIMNEEGRLNQGEHGIIYTLDLPHIIENANGKIEYVEGLTNLIGNNTIELKAKIFLEEKEESTPDEPKEDEHQNKEETVVNKKDEVDTSDRSLVLPFLMTGYISLLVILVEMIKRKEK